MDIILLTGNDYTIGFTVVSPTSRFGNVLFADKVSRFANVRSHPFPFLSPDHDSQTRYCMHTSIRLFRVKELASFRKFPVSRVSFDLLR